MDGVEGSQAEQRRERQGQKDLHMTPHFLLIARVLRYICYYLQWPLSTYVAVHTSNIAFLIYTQDQCLQLHLYCTSIQNCSDLWASFLRALDLFERTVCRHLFVQSASLFPNIIALMRIPVRVMSPCRWDCV